MSSRRLKLSNEAELVFYGDGTKRCNTYCKYISFSRGQNIFSCSLHQIKDDIFVMGEHCAKKNELEILLNEL